MVAPHELTIARDLMTEFADRTGLLRAVSPPRRYLWTDAFAVCAFLSLFEATGDRAHLDRALGLIAQVHETLGRHRQDDPRVGWISGLDEDEGRRHPTAGGLRIGKQLNERAAGQLPDAREEWDRDGQYFHYLTKWMHALERAATVTSDVTYCRWALELARAAFAAFSYRPANDGTRRMYWKMSIDLVRPLVASMGHHDPLDALVSFRELELCRRARFPTADLPDLGAEIASAARICAGRDWATDDPLGIGGLLTDIHRLCALRAAKDSAAGPEIGQLLRDAQIGLAAFASSYPLDAAAERRLAFRELGLAIGLHAIADVNERLGDGTLTLPADAASELDPLLRFVFIAERIESFWLTPANQAVSSWQDHVDINAVMLATSLLPGQFLSI